MGKRIVVAGAGHGGIIAAYNLAKAGYDVSILEMKAKQSELGYDWEDSVERKIFAECSLPEPKESEYRFSGPMKFYNPNLKTPLTVKPVGEGSVMMERK